MRLLFLVLCAVLIGCDTPEPLERSSEHFRFLGDSKTASAAELEHGIQRGEALYDAIAAIIPSTIELTPVIEVRLNGDFDRQSPYIDSEGTIQLYRYPAEEGGYWALFAHELVHAIAFDHALKVGALNWPSLGFYNEGWAEYLAQVLDPEKTGFPLYGFDDEVVVGHWVSHGGLTLAALRESHRKLNQSCELQAYPMRASWFRYVDETFGRQASLDIMYGGREMTPAVVEAILGRPLATVDEAWRAWVLSHYAEHPPANTQAYLERIGFYEPCGE